MWIVTSHPSQDRSRLPGARAAIAREVGTVTPSDQRFAVLIEIAVGDPQKTDFLATKLFGALLSYPTTDGRIECYEEVTRKLHAIGARVAVATETLQASPPANSVPPAQVAED